MGLQSWLLNRRLNRLKQKLKTAHAEQRSVRKKIEEIEDLHERGKMSEAEFRGERARLERKKHELIAKINELDAAEADAKLQLAAES
jgi:chromosome segregation ATPase